MIIQQSEIFVKENGEHLRYTYYLCRYDFIAFSKPSHNSRAVSLAAA